MNCQELDALLDDWLDGALAPSEAARVEAHLAECDACRESERRLRRLLAHAAALPRSLSPANDLWPGVERRLSRPEAWHRRIGWGPALALAAAAAVAVAIAAVLWQAQSVPTVHTVRMPESRPTITRVAADAAVQDPVLAQAERDYEAAANALLETLQQRRTSLAAGDLEAIQANLQVIDRALSEVRQALAKDPGNLELNRMLVATHRKKVDVLRRVVFLSTAL